MSKTESRKLSDDYEVAEVLGRGGFSIVRRGVSKSEGKAAQQVAIKTLRRLGPATTTGGSTLPPQQGSNKGGGLVPTWKQVSSISDALLTNEILVMRRIVEAVAPHPNVIALHDVYEDARGVHLVLELCSGGELFDRIVGRDRHYSEFDAAGVVRQIARGLQALHGAGVVHRDLKPENCLFADRGEASTLKIMDFGLSSVEDFSDPVVTLFGSIDYVSPEALSRQDVSAASDMWSVGVILYILLSGCPPFHAPTNREKQQRILQGEFSFQDHTWKTISSSAKELISSLLSVEPYKRPTASDLLGHPWVIGDCAKQDLMDAEVVTKLQRFNARRKLRAAAIASVLSSKVALRTKRLRNLLGRHDLSSEELDNLRAHFARICADGENATLAEFEQVLRAMRLEALVPLAPRVFDLFDNNRDGTVDMREILCGLSSLRNSRGDDALRLCFQMYDADRSGCISKDELASMLRVRSPVRPSPSCAARGVPSGRHHGAREAGRGVRRDGRQRRRQGELRGVQGGHAEGQRPPGRRPLVPPAAAAAIARRGERFQLVQLHSHENAPLITVPFESFNQSPACAVVRSGRLAVGNYGSWESLDGSC
uniref:calcium/calmodulin-dependent protein kinase n=1 Tax=Zea mays TaxID=4577 RepID=A0A804P0P9_MAIZE